MRTARGFADSEEERKETGRVEAFSDGVFAIAATLLVLGIAVPTSSSLAGKSLLAYLEQPTHWTAFAAYVVSFLVILVMWINHHSIFDYVSRFDRPFVVLNGLLLMMVVFVNYPTALVANFIGTGGDNARVAAVVYSATFVVVAVLYIALWFRAALGRRLIAASADQAEVDRISRQYRFGPVMYLAVVGVALVVPWLSVALNGAIALYWGFTGQIGEQERLRARLLAASGIPPGADPSTDPPAR